MPSPVKEICISALKSPQINEMPEVPLSFSDFYDLSGNCTTRRRVGGVEVTLDPELLESLNGFLKIIDLLRSALLTFVNIFVVLLLSLNLLCRPIIGILKLALCWR